MANRNLDVQNLSDQEEQIVKSAQTHSSENTIRYNKEAVQNHIKKWLEQDPSEFCYEGLAELKRRAVNGSLRQGQIIFQEVRVSQHLDLQENSITGYFTDLLAPILLLLGTRQPRSFAYFHAAVYVGEYNNRFYVVENGGFDEAGNFGTIALETFESAFHENKTPSKYFVVSPPRDEEGNTLRYAVVQRALASIGVRYRYTMRAVNCETFATAMFGNDRISLDPIQDGIIRAKKSFTMSEDTLTRHVNYYKEFHKDLYKQIHMVPTTIAGTLKLSEYINRPDKKISPWFHEYNLNTLRQPIKLKESYYKVNIAPSEETMCVKERYSDLKYVGNGSYGIVVSGKDSMNSITADDGKQEPLEIAIKKLYHPFYSTAHTIRTYREINFLRQFNHENIIGLVDCFTPAVDYASFQEVYLVTQLMDTDLYKILRSSTNLTDDHRKWIIYQIIRGLEYLCSANISHRDLKPSNIGINRDCHVRIFDFGHARFGKSDFDFGYVASRYYRPPELLLKMDWKKNTIDMWSVGCIFAEMITQQILFPGDGFIDQLKRILSLVGKPNERFIGMLPTASAKKWFKEFPDVQRTDFNTFFDYHENPKAIDLLQRMLKFNHLERIDPREALSDPYISEFFEPDEDITLTHDIVDTGCSDDWSLEETKMKIWDELENFQMKNLIF